MDVGVDSNELSLFGKRPPPQPHTGTGMQPPTTAFSISYSTSSTGLHSPSPTSKLMVDGPHVPVARTSTRTRVHAVLDLLEAVAIRYRRRP